MPSTSVAARQNSWKRQKHLFRIKDAARLSRREAAKLAKAKLMTQRKASSKH